jgi:proteasome lid subunit RPN8/RPN11
MIHLRRQQLAAIEDAAEAAYPAECCGLLAGSGMPGDGAVRVTRVVASRNLCAGERNDRFEIDPQTHFDLLRELRGGPERVVGHYHSHPDHPARPSPRDLETAYDFSMVWLVTGVDKGRATATTAHRVAPGGDGFVEIPIEIGD